MLVEKESWLKIEEIVLWTQGNGYEVDRVLDFTDCKYEYYVSNLGNIKRFSKRGVYMFSNKPKKNGYVANNFVDSEGKQYKLSRHQIVAQIWLADNMATGHTVDHIDRNKTNNSVENLRWATPTQQCENR